MSLLTYLTHNCTFQSLNHSVCVCVCLPAINVSAFDSGSLCRLPARLMNFSCFWQIMHRAGRTGPEPAIGSPDRDRSFFVGLVPLEADGMASWSSVASCLSRARRLSTFAMAFLSVNLR